MKSCLWFTMGQDCVQANWLAKFHISSFKFYQIWLQTLMLECDFFPWFVPLEGSNQNNCSLRVIEDHFSCQWIFSVDQVKEKAQLKKINHLASLYISKMFHLFSKKLFEFKPFFFFLLFLEFSKPAQYIKVHNIFMLRIVVFVLLHFRTWSSFKTLTWLARRSPILLMMMPPSRFPPSSWLSLFLSSRRRRCCVWRSRSSSRAGNSFSTVCSSSCSSFCRPLL